MAQVVGYYEDNVVYAEGPFVLTQIHGPGDCRIEVDEGSKCPVMISRDVREILQQHGPRPLPAVLRGPVSLLAPFVDWLNAEVAAKRLAWVPGRGWEHRT